LERYGEKFQYSWLRHKVPQVITLRENNKVGSVEWDVSRVTPEKIAHNKPDLFVTLPDGKKFIIEVAVPLDINAARKWREKEMKYVALAEQERIASGVYPFICPIVVGCLGAVPKKTINTLALLKQMGISVPIARLQRAAIVGSCKIAKQVLCTPQSG
jgi:hypothetical protein